MEDFFIMLLICQIVGAAIVTVFWEFKKYKEIADMTKEKLSLSIPIHADFTIQQIFEKLNSLNSPLINSCTIDSNNKITLESRGVKNYIYEKDNVIFIGEEKYFTRHATLKSLENGRCLQEYLLKTFEPSANIDPQATFSKLESKSSYRLIANIILIPLLILSFLGIIFTVFLLNVISI